MGRPEGPSTLGDRTGVVQSGRMMIDEGLELLEEDEAWDLLLQGHVGRVGVTMGAMPAIFPVNYCVVDDAIVFRTAAGSKLTAAMAGAVVAFEVDDYDRSDRSGWSVLVVGRSEHVQDVDVAFKVLAARLEPWVEGRRVDLVRIHPTFLSGRRIVHDSAGPAADPTIHG